MPPKKTNSGASKKTEIKKKEKIIEVRNKIKKKVCNSFFSHSLSYIFRIKHSV